MKTLKREMYLERIRPFYESDLVKILVGMRRCGKSTIMSQIMDEIKQSGVREDRIIYINFELLCYRDLSDAVLLESYVSANLVPDGKNYLFFDEVQKVKDFEDAVNSLRVSADCSIFIAGSNGKLSSSEIKSSLTGRYVKFRIQPLSYKESIDLLSLNGRPCEEDTFYDYLRWGGLPQRFFFVNEDDIRVYLSDVYDSIILKDIVERFGVRDPEVLVRTADYLVDNSSRLFSVNSVVRYLKSNKLQKSTETVYNYVSYVVSSLIVDRVRRYDTRGKKILASLEKYYAADCGIRNIRSVDALSDMSVNLELIVYNELVARRYTVYVGSNLKTEIDFVAEHRGSRVYIQVCYLMADEKTRDREFGSLLEIRDNHPKVVLSMDRVDMSHEGIKHLYIVDWLLGRASFR